MPTLGNVATQLEDIHKDVRANQGGDQLTRLILGILMADLTIVLVLLFGWVGKLDKTDKSVTGIDFGCH